MLKWDSNEDINRTEVYPQRLMQNDNMLWKKSEYESNIFFYTTKPICIIIWLSQILARQAYNI